MTGSCGLIALLPMIPRGRGEHVQGDTYNSAAIDPVLRRRQHLADAVSQY